MASDESGTAWFTPDRPLNRRFALFLPSKTKDDSATPRFEEQASDIAACFSSRFGGATIYPATGFFESSAEKVLLIETFCTEDDWNDASADISALIRSLARELFQEMFACSLDGSLLLIKPDASSQTSAEILGRLKQSGEADPALSETPS